MKQKVDLHFERGSTTFLVVKVKQINKDDTDNRRPPNLTTISKYFSLLHHFFFSCLSLSLCLYREIFHPQNNMLYDTLIFAFKCLFPSAKRQFLDFFYSFHIIIHLYAHRNGFPMLFCTILVGVYRSFP